LAEPTYFERDRYDLPLPLIRVNPNIIASETTLVESLPSDSSSEQQQLIFQALTQVLSPLGVRFKFSIQRHPQTQLLTADREHTMLQSPDVRVQILEYRLWVRCHSQKSLDCQLLSEPLAKKLRSLNLQGFQDAIVQFSRFSAVRNSAPAKNQVADWLLRLDLTPPTVRLKNWARWGDVQSITKLLNFALAPESIQVNAVLKNLTLQIFCTFKQPHSQKFPAKQVVIDTIAPLLISLTPQGIQGATIHGVQSQPIGQVEVPPAWIHWLDLPALGDPKFSPTPIILAGRGDRDALNFILERLLNPDLEQCFEIGGISLSLLHRHQLLHVMSEGPICPIQSQVATTVVKVLRQFNLPGIRGVRVHGRISGQSVSKWTYGVDFDAVEYRNLPQGDSLKLPAANPVHQFVTEPSPTKIGLGQRMAEYLLATGIWQPQFTMVKTSQLVYQQRFKWQPSLLLLLVGLGLAMVSDVAIKLALETRHLTASSTATIAQLSFNNSLLEQKLAQYQIRCLQQGVPDVLIVGSLIDRGYPNSSVYNFGINGATAQVVDLILRQLLTPKQLPKLVIWADGARAFNSGRIDRTYDTIALSDRYRKLALMSGFKNSNSSILQVQSSFQNTYQAIDTAIDRQLEAVSPAYHHRDRLKTWLQARVPFFMEIADSSNAISSTDPTASINEREIDTDGFLPLELKFDPTTYYQKYTKVTGDSDGDYANFQLIGNQDRAFQQTIDFLTTQKIPLVFVNIPLSDIYLDKLRRQHETGFKQYMQQLMDSNKITFIDMDGFLNKQYDRRYLAQTEVVPWQTLRLKRK
jgi:hypothetical protein